MHSSLQRCSDLAVLTNVSLGIDTPRGNLEASIHCMLCYALTVFQMSSFASEGGGRLGKLKKKSASSTGRKPRRGGAVPSLR